MSEPGTLALFHRLVHQSSEVEIGPWETEDEADVRRSRRTVAYRQAARGPGWFRRLCGACASAALALLLSPRWCPGDKGCRGCAPELASGVCQQGGCVLLRQHHACIRPRLLGCCHLSVGEGWWETTPAELSVTERSSSKTPAASQGWQLYCAQCSL